MSGFDDLIGPLLAREGGYTNNSSDSGGETNFGITDAVAHANGYAGSMISLTRDEAAMIYKTAYWSRPGFDMVAQQSFPIAAELFDCGVNMGLGTAGTFLQRCLNVFNREEQDYADVPTDGQVGAKTLDALKSFLARRGTEGEGVLLKAVRCLRGAKYITLAEGLRQDELFVYGWVANRIGQCS